MGVDGRLTGLFIFFHCKLWHARVVKKNCMWVVHRGKSGGGTGVLVILSHKRSYIQPNINVNGTLMPMKMPNTSFGDGIFLWSQYPTIIMN